MKISIALYALVLLPITIISATSTKRPVPVARKGSNSVIISMARKSSGKNFGSKKQLIEGTASVGLENAGNYAYYANISVGTPPQTLTLLVDTGSSVFWVGSAECNAQKNCIDGSSFDPTKSSTFTTQNVTDSTTYGDGSGLSGITAYDTITLGNIVLPNQQFLLALKENHAMRDYQKQSKTSGMLGLAWENGLIYEDGTQQKAAKDGWYPEIIGSLISQGHISNPMFSMWLNGNSNLNSIDYATGGELVLGGINPNHYTGKISYYPVIDAFFWCISFYGGYVGNMKFTVVDGTSAIMDSGSTYLTMESSVLSTIYNQLYLSLNQTVPKAGSDGFQTFSCASISHLPTISFNFGDSTLYTLFPTDYVQKYGTARGICYFMFKGVKSDPRNGPPEWIFGDVFLRKFLTVYKYGTNRTNFNYGGQDGPMVGLAVATSLSPSYTPRR